MNITIKFEWTAQGPTHVGTGISRLGHADRLIRCDWEHRPVIPGDAVKGAIRGTAERLLRWLLPGTPQGPEESSMPDHPVLRRIFAPQEISQFYRFQPASLVHGSPNLVVTVSSTAIDYQSGTAKTDSLRTMESLVRKASFQGIIKAYNGDWSNSNSPDYWDLMFLWAAILATDGVAGKKGAGYGRVLLSNPSCESDVPHPKELKNPETIARLREYLSEQNNASDSPKQEEHRV